MLFAPLAANRSAFSRVNNVPLVVRLTRIPLAAMYSMSSKRSPRSSGSPPERWILPQPSSANSSMVALRSSDERALCRSCRQ